MIRLGHAFLALLRRLRGQPPAKGSGTHLSRVSRLLWPGPQDDTLLRVAFGLLVAVVAVLLGRVEGWMG